MGGISEKMTEMKCWPKEEFFLLMNSFFILGKESLANPVEIFRNLFL